MPVLRRVLYPGKEAVPVAMFNRRAANGVSWVELCWLEDRLTRSCQHVWDTGRLSQLHAKRKISNGKADKQVL